VLLWARQGTSSSEAVFPPVSGLIMLCPHVALYFAVVFSPFLPNNWAVAEACQQYAIGAY